MRDAGVVIIADSLDSGAIDRAAADTAIAVAGRGWRVLAVSAGGNFVRELKRADVDHLQMAVATRDPFSTRGNLRRMAEAVKSFDAAIIHAFTPDAAYYASKVSARLGIPYVASYLRIYTRRLFSLSPYRAPYLARAGMVIAPSDFMGSFLQAAYRIPHDRIAIIPAWIDADVYDRRAVSAERIIRAARSLRIPEDKFIIVSLAGLEKPKGIPTLLEALAALPGKKRRSVQLIIASPRKGSPRVRRRLAAQVAKLGLADCVHIATEQTDIPAILMLSDVYVATDVEPRAFQPHVLQAESLGRPILAPNLGATGEYVFDADAVRLYEPGDAPALCALIAGSMDMSKDLRERIASKAHSHIRINFSRENLAPKTADIYGYVLNRGKKRA